MRNSTTPPNTTPNTKHFACRHYEEDKCTSTHSCSLNCTSGKPNEQKYCHNMFQNISGTMTLSWAGCLHNEHCKGVQINHGHCDVHHFKDTEDGRQLFICCCTGNYCNRNITYNSNRTTPTAITTSSKCYSHLIRAGTHLNMLERS